MRREARSLRPPIFLEHFLSGTDSRRDRQIMAQSRLRSQRKRTEYLAAFSNDSWAVSGRLPRSENRAYFKRIYRSEPGRWHTIHSARLTLLRRAWRLLILVCSYRHSPV